jgi:hypothetical protein
MSGMSFLSSGGPVNETQLLIAGKLLSAQVIGRRGIGSLRDVEFKVFSQFGDDGIIQWLIRNVDIPERSFIEFGVEDYRESNTRFLMMNDNWSGMVMDGSQENVSMIVGSEYYWRYDLLAQAHFIDRDNINDLLAASPLGPNIGILSIDLDGNDYWILERIEAVFPCILIVEYNSVFGIERAVTIPYQRDFARTSAHFSNLYWGASLRALATLCAKKGYAFVGSNSAGNNAYFVRRDKLNDEVREARLEAEFVDSKFRESRDASGALTYLRGADRIAAIRGLPVVDVAQNSQVPL